MRSGENLLLHYKSPQSEMDCDSFIDQPLKNLDGWEKKRHLKCPRQTANFYVGQTIGERISGAKKSTKID